MEGKGKGLRRESERSGGSNLNADGKKDEKWTEWPINWRGKEGRGGAGLAAWSGAELELVAIFIG